MANNCVYNLKVIGDTKKSVEEFIQMMTYSHPSGRYFARFFSADPEPIEENNGRYSTKVFGDCAWSVYSCMCDGPSTYYRDLPGGELTCLQIETRRLGLTVEVFSEEPGIGFAEHYIFHKGKWLVNEERDFHEYWLDDDFDSIDDFMKEYELDLSPEQIEFLEENGYVQIGGFDQKFIIS